MKNLLTICRVLVGIGLLASVYLLFVKGIYGADEINHRRVDSYLILSLFLLVGLLMSFKKSLYRESGAVLMVGGVVAGFYYFTMSGEGLVALLYAALIVIPGVVFWFSEKKSSPGGEDAP